MFRPEKAPRARDLKEVDDLDERTKREIETFFRTSILGTGKALEFCGWQGPDQALRLIRNGEGRFAKRHA
jgi:inorganic pyrophosphatase